MKNLSYIVMSALLVTLAFGFAPKTAMAQDLAAVMPKDVKVLIDNDRVRVLEVVHKPGVKEPMHSHPAYVSVFLNATKLKYTTPDGKTGESERKAGEVKWSGPVTHAVENIGKTDQHVIVIELK